MILVALRGGRDVELVQRAKASEVKVGQLDVATVVDQNILGLEVAVHDPKRVEVLERGQDLGGVESGVLVLRG